MRHRKKINHLSRTDAHRKAMLANMASSLILQKRITTTTAKAKALRIFVEPLISRSKEDTTHSRRMVFKHLRDKYAVTELFREVAEKVGDRPGGYTRIIKIGNRLGDNADMCIIELVDYNENLLIEKAAEKPKTSRRRRGGKKKSEEGIEAVSTDVKDAEESISEDSKLVAETSSEGPELTSEPGEEVITEAAEEVQTEPGEEVITEAAEEVKTEPGEEVITEAAEEVKTEPAEEVKAETTAEVKTETAEEIITEVEPVVEPEDPEVTSKKEPAAETPAEDSTDNEETGEKKQEDKKGE